MILNQGTYWQKIDHTDPKLVELVSLLNQAEDFIEQTVTDIRTRTYWGISGAIIGNQYLNDIGHGLPVTYQDIMLHLPQLKELMTELDLIEYIGRNIQSNWGIHRHHASSDYHWNMCILGKGNNNGALNFHQVDDSENEYSSIPVYDHLPYNTRIIETVKINEGEIFSLNTWQWHSHTTPETGRVETFLLHFNKK
jgi:hypothetical protein